MSTRANAKRPITSPSGAALPFWRHIRWNLIFYFVVLAVLPVSIIVALVVPQLQNQARRQAADQLESISELKSQEIAQWLTDSQSALSILVVGAANQQRFVLLTDPNIVSRISLQRTANEIFARALEQDPGFSEFFFYDTNGEVLASSDETQLGKIVTRQPYFTPSLADSYIQTPYYEIGGGQLTMLVTLPIRDTDNTVVGAVAGQLNLDLLGQIMLERTGLPGSGETYLVSAQSNYLLTPSRFGGYELTRAYHSVGIDQGLAGENGSGTYNNYQNPPVRVIGVYRWIPSLQAALLAEVDEADALSAFNTARFNALLLTMGGALLAILVGLYAATRVSRPILALTNTATRIAGGDLKERATVRQRNELGLLASAFNDMADQLQQLIGSLEERVSARTRDLFLTLEVGQLATRVYQQEDLLPRVTDFIRERFDLYYTQVYLIDDAQRYAVLAAGTGEVGEQLLDRHHRLDLRETTIVTQAAQTQRPVLVLDTEASPVHKLNPLLPETRSEVAIPLIVGDQVIGVLDMQARQAETFREDNLPVFEAMANQLASAVRSARSYAETRVAVERADAINRRLTGAAWESYLGHLSIGEAVGYEYDLQEVTSFSDALAAAEGVSGDGNERQLVHPVALRGQPIGAIQLEEDSDRTWTAEEVELVKDVAERVALAVEQFRAFDATQIALTETEEQAQRLAELNAMAAELSAAPDLNAVYRIVATWTDRILRGDRASLTLLTADGEAFDLYGLDGVQGAIPLGTKLPRKDTWIGVVADGGRVRRLDDMSREPYLETKQLSGQGLCSSLNAPLIVGTRMIGTLNVARKELYGFSQRDENLIAQIASLLTSHLQNQQLLSQTRQRAAEMQAVAEVGAEASATLDPATLLWNVSNLVKERFGLYHAHIYLVDETGGDLILAAGAGSVGHMMVQAGHRIPAGHERSLVARAARMRRGVVVNNVAAAPDFLPNPMLPDTRSELVVPMIVGEQVIGVLDVQSDELNHFAAGDVQVQSTLAAQVAVAVNNARLFEQTQQRAAEMQAVAEVGAEASATLDQQELLWSVANLVKERFGLYHAHIYLLDETGQNLVLAAGAGEPGKLMVASGHRIPMRHEQSLVVRAARTRESVIVNDVTHAPDFLPNPMLPRTRAELATPMIVGRQVIGVLDVQSERQSRFSAQDVQVQLTLASQIAVAVNNARLFGEQLEVADRLREVDRLKSEFLASMSHELRTPLNSIIGYAEVLLDGIDGELTDDMNEDVGAIHGSGKHLLNLINDILDLAKIEAGQMDLVMEDFDLRPLAEDALSTQRVLLKDKAVELVLDIPADLPHIHADPLRVRQVIGNLITNAIKFTEQGSITIHADSYAPDPSLVEVAVIDTGIGMRPDQLDVIFDRFRQVDQSHTRRAGGTGLGLSITRQLVELHSGQIWVESELGLGSAFHFTLPTAVENVDG
jgi:signal transduction histidine kinase/HAMP domain-containing protein